MTVMACVGEVAVLGAFFAAIAAERARAYGVSLLPMHPSAVLAAILAPAIGAWLASRGAGGWSADVVLACGAVSAVTDLRSGYVFDRVAIVAAALLLGVTIGRGALLEATLGALAFGGLPLVAHACSRGRAIGCGDVKLAAVLGLGLGPVGGLEAIWVAAISGGAAAAWLLLLQRVERTSELRFAPYLALGAGFALVRAA